MKLFLVCMIRNEIDILPAFLSHIYSLFDSGCLIDHLSSDGSENLLRNFTARRSDWNYHQLRTHTYAQAEVSSEALHRGFKQGADAVFFLDADEFIASMSRQSLEEAITFLDSSQLVGQLRWRNCMPEKYGDHFSLNAPVWICGQSPHKKLVIPGWMYRSYGSTLQMNQGNHSIRVPAGISLRAAQLGELLHFPIRSRAQFIRKVIVSYVSQAMKPDRIVAPHICALFDIMTNRDLSSEMLNALAADYGAQTTNIQPLSYAELASRGYLLSQPEVCYHQLDLQLPQTSNKVINFGDFEEYAQENSLRLQA